MAFKDVVARAGATLTRLNDTNGRIFQQKLAQLRVSSGLSEAEFLAKATPYVKDDATAAMDRSTQDVLAEVQSIGNGDTSSEAVRCGMLNDLKALMDKVVSNTSLKWQHIIEKVSAAAEGAAVTSAPR